MQGFDGKAWFLFLSFFETVHDTVQYKYCILSLLYRLLWVRLKRQNPLLSYVRERERERARERDRQTDRQTIHSKCTM